MVARGAGFEPARTIYAHRLSRPAPYQARATPPLIFIKGAVV
jgi:hypothetical protein